VAVTGVALPLAGGYLVGLAFGAEPILALFLGATLTATSVGVTARVLRDLGRLDSPEARVILGAAVIDDVLGLMLLTLITRVLAGGSLSAGGALRTLVTGVAFLAGAILLGHWLAPRGARLLGRLRVQGALIAASMSLAFALALLADLAGSAAILGAFAAGLILAGTDQRLRIERTVRPVAHLFVPIFFVVVGAQVDLRPFNPLVSGNWPLIAGVLGLSALAIATKWAAGVAPFWLDCRKNVIGVGMIPRGEVGLIFAQVGRTSGLLSEGQFGGIVLVVMITTFAAPVLLRRMLSRDEGSGAAGAGADGPAEHTEGVEELVSGIE
jgi:Kef-type K+ transport system membrane component KefB